MLKRVMCAGALGAMLLAGCQSTPSMTGSMWAPSLAQLQSMCGASGSDYGAESQSVYSAFFDAYVAQKRGKVSKEQYCAFQTAIAEKHAAYAADRTPQAQNAWVAFFNDQRAQAISWRASVDPTLRAG
jgi:hypothetical protein